MQIGLPVINYKEVEDWDEKRRQQYAGIMIGGYGPQSNTVYFNTVGGLINLIDLIESAAR